LELEERNYRLFEVVGRIKRRQSREYEHFRQSQGIRFEVKGELALFASAGETLLIKDRPQGKLRKLDLNFEPEGDLELSMLPVVPLLRQVSQQIIPVALFNS
jgi:hypothetical protein